MKWPAYSRYKPSGVEWLGDVPADWMVIRLKGLLTAPLQYGANEAADSDDPSLPRFVRITDIADDGTLREDTFRSLPEGVAGPYMLQDEDLLLARSGATCGKTILYRSAWGRCCYAGYLIRARLHRGRAVPAFVRYFTASESYWQWIASTFIQATIQNVSAERFSSLLVPLPSLVDQQGIVDFLDERTAKVDALIAKKRTLAERLKEKRTALISRTVTRGLPPEAARAAGLNPHPKLRPSGVEWLGDVPDHWEVTYLRRHITSIEQGWSPSCENRPAEEGEWGVVKVGCVNYGRFEPTENKALPSSLEPLPRLEIRPGDVLMSRANTRELVGSVAFVDETPSRLMLCDKVFRLRYIPMRTAPRFLTLALESRIGREQVEREATGASGSMQNIGQDSVRRLLLAWPPFTEQNAIVDYLDRETAKLDRLTAKVEAAIERLQEYRTALITAAVTGKIDVRRAEAKIAVEA